MNKVLVLGVMAIVLAGCADKEEAAPIVDNTSQDVSVCRESSVGGVPQDTPTFVDGNGQPCDPNAPAEAAVEAAPAEAAVEAAPAEAAK